MGCCQTDPRELMKFQKLNESCINLESNNLINSYENFSQEENDLIENSSFPTNNETQKELGVYKVKKCDAKHSAHLSCPLKNKLNTQDLINSHSRKQETQKQIHCKVKGCKEKHPAHYCKSCKNQDSDHFSRDCIPTNKKVNCKLKGCTHNHEFHFCRFCENQDSDHLAIDCPQSIILYHASKLDYLEMDNGIREIGLIPSEQGTTRFGKGIYFAEEKYVEDIKENLFGNEGVVLKCRVWLGKCKDFGNDVDYNGNWNHEGYDSCTAIHPPWFRLGATSINFREYVVKNPRKVKIYNLTYKGKEFRMGDYKQDQEILELIKKEPFFF